MTPEKAGFRFTVLYTPATLMFVFTNALMGPFLARADSPLFAHYIGAALTAFAVLVGSYAFARVMKDSDEYLRKLTFESLGVATALTLTFTAAYGYLMSYAEAPHMSLIFIVPLFATFFALTTGYQFATGKFK